MSQSQQSFFKTNDVASWSTPLPKRKSNKTDIKHEDYTDDEVVDYAPNTKGKGRRVGRIPQHTSTTGVSSKNKVSNKKDITHNKVTTDKVTKSTTKKNNINRPLPLLASKPVQADATPHPTVPQFTLPYRPLPRKPVQSQPKPSAPKKTRAPRPPVVPKFDKNGKKIPEPNVRWNEPMAMCALFAVLESVNSDPAIDTQQFWANVGNVMTADPERRITGNAVVQFITKLRRLRLAAATPLQGVDTIADLVDFSQQHQRGKLAIGVYSKKDLRVAVAPTPALPGVVGQPMATSSQVVDEEEDEEEEEVEEELEGGGESAVDYLSPAEWVAAAYPEQTSFEMDPFWATQNEPAQMAADLWSLTPAVSSSVGSYDPLHYAWGFSPEQEVAWQAEIQGGLPTNQDFSFTGCG